MGWLAYALLSTLLVGFSSICEKLGLQNTNTDTLLVTAIQSFITSTFLLVRCIALKQFTVNSVSLLITNNGRFIFLAGIITAFSWLFYVNALKYGSVSKVESIDRLSLLFTIILSTIFLGEPLELKSIAGGLLMAIGAWLIVVEYHS